MGIKEDLEIPLSMLEISFLDKSKYKGSYRGKRFLFEKVDDNKLKVYIWKDLFNFENTDQKDMIIKEFEYNKDGIDEGLKFVEETKV